MTLSVIVAASSNNVIGRNNELPWSLHGDLARFSSLTRNHTVIMGRNTFLSILKRNGKPLPERKNVVLSDVDLPESLGFNNVFVFNSWEKVFEAVKHDGEVFIIGGATVYKECLKYADKLFLTRVKTSVEGDAYFTGFEKEDWDLNDRESHKADTQNDCDYEFLTYSKKPDKNKVYLANARTSDQFNVMDTIIKAGVCPFCFENFKKYHKKELLRDGKYWILTYNQWPYENSKVHLLAVYKEHAENLTELDPRSGEELISFLAWACTKFKVNYGGFAMRFGDPKNTGGSVSHIHVQFIQPDIGKEGYQPVRFKIG